MFSFFAGDFMSDIKTKIVDFAGKVYAKFGSVAQEKTERAAAEKTYTREMQSALRRVAAECAVLPFSGEYSITGFIQGTARAVMLTDLMLSTSLTV